MSVLNERRQKDKTKDVVASPVAMNPWNSGQNADPIPVPATSYAYARTPINSPYRPAQGVQVNARSGVVDRRPRRNGWEQSYAYGYSDMWEQTGTPLMATGQVAKSAFQPVNNLLMDWFINTRWYEAGYPAASVMNGALHNIALSFKVPGLTNINGGSRWSSMTARPQYTRVQNIPRYSSTPLAYNTTSAPD